MSVYQNHFSSWEDVVLEFTGSRYKDENEKKDLLKDYPEPKVLYANYDNDSYDGEALVIWTRNRRYYLLQGSHCSCYGLEETGFDPIEYKSKTEFYKALVKMKYLRPMDNETFQDFLKKIKPKNMKHVSLK